MKTTAHASWLWRKWDWLLHTPAAMSIISCLQVRNTYVAAVWVSWGGRQPGLSM